MSIAQFINSTWLVSFFRTAATCLLLFQTENSLISFEARSLIETKFPLTATLNWILPWTHMDDDNISEAKTLNVFKAVRYST